MNVVELLKRQTRDAYGWTNKLVESIPIARWDEIPTNIESSVTWQTGHIIMSLYFHSIMVIRGHQMDIIQKIPMREYAALFTKGVATHSVGKTEPATLLQQLQAMQEKSLEIIGTLSTEEMDASLEPTDIPHPIATTKFEALDWNIKHTMWHCGQLAILKRVLGERYDFGLQTA